MLQLGMKSFLNLLVCHMSWNSLRPNPTAPYSLQVYTSCVMVSIYQLVFIDVCFQVFPFSFYYRCRIGIEFRTSDLKILVRDFQD